MPNVTVNYKMFLPGGRHRQPGNTSVDLQLAPILKLGAPTPPGFFPQLPYDPANDMA
jgi:hypothetical protein